MPLRLLHRAVLATRGLPGLGRAYRRAYEEACRACGRALKALPEVRSVLLHRGLCGRDWEPGVSDIDLILLLEDAPPEAEAERLERISGRVGLLRHLFPMLGDVWMGERAELRRYLRHGGLRAWEDFPSWRLLAGEAPPADEVPGSGQSEVKTRWLDPWTWAFVSYMELCRRTFLEGKDLPEKRLLDARKLYLDLGRFARSATRPGDRPGGRPVSREEMRSLLPEAGRMDGRELRLEGCRLLAEASRAVLERCSRGARARLDIPPPGPASSEERALRSLRDAGARLAVYDPPYHSFAVVDDGGAEAGNTALDAALGECGKKGMGVPMAVPASAWALCLQSAYLGAPLGWLDAGPMAGGEGLSEGWRTVALGESGDVPRLDGGLAWECAAEAASWMALWRRTLWMDASFDNRFALFHLHTRSLGLRLALDGAASGPLCDFGGLVRRSKERFPGESQLLESLEGFIVNEPRECVDALPRARLAPEHLGALSVCGAAIGGLLEAGRPACPA